VETERARQTHDAATRDAYARRIPMRRYATPQEVAAAAVFLCGDDSGYVTGHTLNVDGGFRVAGLIRDDPAS
jgi:3-oxoacyl-[acyl-carrier protein] reductase